MDMAKIRGFMDARRPGGYGAEDIHDLVALVGKKASEKTAARQLEKVAVEFGPLFTDSGAKLFEKLTGVEPMRKGAGKGHTGGPSSLVDARIQKSVPKSWDLIAPSKVTKVVDELVANGDVVHLKLKSGRLIDVEADDRIPKLVKSGAMKLYVNEHDEEDSDDEGGTIWYPGHYLVPGPAFKNLDKEVQKHVDDADAITAAITKELDKLHSTIHASRVNGFAPFDLKKIKAEVAAEIPKAKAAIIAYEKAQKQWASDTQTLDDMGDFDAYMVAKAAVAASEPKINSISLRDLNFTKDLIRASELLLARPEIEAIDPGFGIRINVNTDTLVKNGGDYKEWQAEVTKLLADHLITDEINFSRQNNWDGAIDVAQKALKKAIGAANVTGGWSMGDKDFADGVRGDEITLYVKDGALAQAKKQIPALKALFAPHGMDLKHFDLKVEKGE